MPFQTFTELCQPAGLLGAGLTRLHGDGELAIPKRWSATWQKNAALHRRRTEVEGNRCIDADLGVVVRLRRRLQRVAGHRRRAESVAEVHNRQDPCGAASDVVIQPPFVITCALADW